VYREFLLLFKAYFKTVTFETFFYDFILPVFLAVSLGYRLAINMHLIFSFTCVLATFLFVNTLTALLFSIFLHKTKTFQTGKRVLGKELTLYREMVVFLFYNVFVSFIGLMLSLFASQWHLLFYLVIFLLLHTGLLWLRNLTNLFFIMFS